MALLLKSGHHSGRVCAPHMEHIHHVFPGSLVCTVPGQLSKMHRSPNHFRSLIFIVLVMSAFSSYHPSSAS